MPSREGKHCLYLMKSILLQMKISRKLVFKTVFSHFNSFLCSSIQLRTGNTVSLLQCLEHFTFSAVIMRHENVSNSVSGTVFNR